MKMRMVMAAGAALLALVLALPAHAQMRGPVGGGTTTTGVGGAPGSAGGGGGSVSGGGGGVGTGGGHSMPSFAPARYRNSAAHGTETDFQPTSFVPYEQAVKMGQAALAQQAKTLGQIAAEYRAAKRHHGN